MAERITVKVAFPPMYVDFIIAKYGSDDEPFVVAHDRNGHVGFVLKSQLRKQPKKPNIRKYNDDEHVSFVLPYGDDLNVRYNSYISENGERVMRRWVRRKFFFDMREHILDLHRVGERNIKSAIESFCDIHNVDPAHYNYDSLKREFYRYRMREKSKKSVKMSTSFLAFLSFFCPYFVPFL